MYMGAFTDKTHGIKAAVSLYLWRPLILGTRWQGFNKLLRQYVGF